MILRAHRYLAILFLASLGISLFVQPAIAQTRAADTVILRPYGDDPREPKLYFEPEGKQTDPIPKKTPKNPDVSSGNLLEPIKTGVKTNTLSLLKKEHLRLDVSGIGKTCRAGSEEPISWEINKDTEITDPIMLKHVAEEALKHDHRIRRIKINDEKLDIYILQPALIFGFIPTNYLLHVKANVATREISIENPKWLKYATTKHDDVTDVFVGNISVLFNQNPDQSKQFFEQSIISRHAFMIETMGRVFFSIPVMPYANSFWICVFVPFFFLFLLLFGIIIGVIWYAISKRKKKKLIDRVQGRDTLYARNKDRDDLDDLEKENPFLASFEKDRKDENTTEFSIRRPKF